MEELKLFQKNLKKYQRGLNLMAGKTIVVDASVKTELETKFPSDGKGTAGLEADQIEYLADIISLELQSQTAYADIKDLFTRIMAV